MASLINHTFILGFPNCFFRTSIPVIPNSLRIGALFYVNRRVLGCQQVSTSSSSKLNDSISTQPEAEMGAVKENTTKGWVDENLSVNNNLETFDRMTVQELRTKLRSVGVTPKGSKRDLVCALKNFLTKEVDDSVEVVEDEISTKVNQVHSEKSSKRKAKSSSLEKIGEVVSTVAEVSVDKKTKRGPKQAPVAETSGSRQAKRRVKQVEVISVNKKELSLNANQVAGKKGTSTKKELALHFASENIGTCDKVVISEEQNEPWTVLAHKKPQKGWIAYNPRCMRPPPLANDVKSVKLMSWNVNGLRALLKLESFSALELAQREDFDILCLQETKLQEKDTAAIKQALLEGYENSFWTCSVSKLGYSGTAIISRITPLSVRYGLGIDDHDSEGRLVTVEFDSFYLINAYVPNSGDGLRRLSYRTEEWDPSLGNYMKELEKSKPVILTGDLNCAHEEIDIYNPAGNKRSAGFTMEERMSFERNFMERGFVDTFRKQHPGVVGYTYWGYRHGGRKTNKGWRLDYFLVSQSMADNVHDSYILPDVAGSDHCPIGLVLKL